MAVQKHHWGHHKYDCISPLYSDYINEYRVWKSMKNRCSDPTNNIYKDIEVCERWKNEEDGFINFYKDMGKRPVESNGISYQLDRIDNHKGYSPDNCRWVTARQNSQNRRNNLYVMIYGDRYCVAEACRMFGVNRTTVTENVRLRDKTPDDAFADALIKKEPKKCVL